jgi:hypothetical protein
MQLGGYDNFLRPFYADFAMDPTANVHQILYKSRKKCDGDPGNDYASVRGRKHEQHMESSNSPRPKKATELKWRSDRGLSREVEGRPGRNGGRCWCLADSWDKMQSAVLEGTSEATEAVVELQELRNEQKNMDKIGSLEDRHGVCVCVGRAGAARQKGEESDPRKWWDPTEVGRCPKTNDTSCCSCSAQGT